jgi:endoglycosylceramidase
LPDILATMVRSLACALLLGLAAACGSRATGSCSLEPASLPDWRLHADGAALRDSLGRLVILRGVAAGGRSKFAPYAPFDHGPGEYPVALAAYLDRAASWGVDVLRVPLPWAAVEPQPGVDDEAFLSRYDQLLDAAWARGIRTVVDFHQDVYSEVYCGDGFPAWTVANPPAPHHDCPGWFFEYSDDANVRAAFDAFWAGGSPVRSAYDALWDRIAARHRDRPGVIAFEPFNEPAPGTADRATFEATTLTDFYGQLAARLREAAPGQLVFFDLPGVDALTQITSLRRPSGDGLVFAPHYYQAQSLAGGAGDPRSVRADLQTWAAQGAAWGVPVFLGEFGASTADPGGRAYTEAHYAALDAFGISGTQWEYSVAAEDWNGEKLGLVAADGSERPAVAGLVRPYPRAVAGSAPAWAYDPSTRGFSLRYAPAKGITEVALPARLYPSGFDVAVTGACHDRSRPGLLLLSADPGASAVTLEVTPR